MKEPPLSTIQLLFLLLIPSIGVVGYLGYQRYKSQQYQFALERKLSETRQDLADTKTELASTTRGLGYTISVLEEDLSHTRGERDELEQTLTDERNKINSLTTQVQEITGAVGTLQKLRTLDPELLKRYSKVYFLNENYVPSRLTQIDPRYVYDPKKGELLHGNVMPFLQSLMERAIRDGADIRLISAYRSFGTQAILKSSYTVVYGAGTANQFSADQGYSEHQLGTTVDFTTSKLGVNFSTFEKTKAYGWLTENAYRYGFIPSYPKHNAYYRFEPWHWRFVGKSLAEKLRREKKYFYDLDQREIDTFLISIFD